MCNLGHLCQPVRVVRSTLPVRGLDACRRASTASSGGWMGEGSHAFGAPTGLLMRAGCPAEPGRCRACSPGLCLLNRHGCPETLPKSRSRAAPYLPATWQVSVPSPDRGVLNAYLLHLRPEERARCRCQASPEAPALASFSMPWGLRMARDRTGLLPLQGHQASCLCGTVCGTGCASSSALPCNAVNPLAQWFSSLITYIFHQ